jgi:flavodoxin I
MPTKVARILTSKGIFFYTVTGKTEAILDSELDGYNIYKLNEWKNKEINFQSYETIIIGSPTYGRGIPPLYFRKLLPSLMSLSGKKIGLFGSGNTIYGDTYCGALDLLEEVLEAKNEIIFKYKYEGYPREMDKQNLKQLLGV